MKIVHLTQNINNSGAGNAAYRIHSELKKMNLETICITVNSKSKNLDGIILTTNTVYEKIKIKLFEFFEYKFTKLITRKINTLFSPNVLSGFSLKKNKYIKEADLICLYWINGAFIKVDDLSYLKNKPIIWRLSDFWPFTGGCHYPSNCLNFISVCKNCPQLLMPSDNDLSFINWQKKFKTYKDLNIHVVAPSKWIKNEAVKSKLFHNFKTTVIHTGINLEKFKPIKKTVSRKTLNLPLDQKIVMSLSPNKDEKRKGFQFLSKALFESKLKLIRTNITLLLVGNESVEMLKNKFPKEMNIISLGKINQDKMVHAYSASDVVVLPSLEDNLPNFILESLACSTPVVAFKIGGIPEAISHKKNGYLAKKEDYKMMANGIAWVLNHKNKDSVLRKNARETAVKKFDIVKQTTAFKNLLEKVKDN